MVASVGNTALRTPKQTEAKLQPPLHLPLFESLDVEAIHATPTFNTASCKTRGPSVPVEAPAPDVIASADGSDDLAPTVMQPSLQAASKSMGAASGSSTVLASAARSPAGSRGPSVSVEETAPELIAPADGGDPDNNNVRQLTPPLNPAPCTTRDPRRAWERFAVQWVRLDEDQKAVAHSVPLLDWLHPRPIPHHGLPARAARQGRRNRRAQRGRGARTGVMP